MLTRAVFALLVIFMKGSIQCMFVIDPNVNPTVSCMLDRPCSNDLMEIGHKPLYT